MLAESRGQSSGNNNSLNVQQSELQTVYISHEDAGRTAQVNSWDSSPMLDSSQNAIRH